MPFPGAEPDEPRDSAVARFVQIAGEPRFKGWPVVGEYKLGAKIPYFGQALDYELETGNGVEQYTSIIRHFGWVVVFGVTEDWQVVTLVQWKPGVNKASWELPPGGIGKVPPGTSMEEIERITRETYLKETGWGSGTWKYLGNILIETGKFRGAGPDDHGLPAHMYLAQGLVRQTDARQPNPNEIMETLLFPVEEMPMVIASGLFQEASALPCALRACMELGLLRWT